MSMQELPDDQLDGLFRKSLEESEPSYDPAAWPGMEEKLATYDRQQFWQRWLRRAVPVVVALVLPVSLWLLTRDNSSADPSGRPRPTRLTPGLAASRSAARSPEKPTVAEVDGLTTGEPESPESVVQERGQSASQGVTGTITTANTNRLQPSAPALAAGPLARTNPKQVVGVARTAATLPKQTESAARTVPTPTTGVAIRRTRTTRTIKPSGADLVAVGPVSRKISGRGTEWAASGDGGSVASQQRTVATAEESLVDRFQLPIEPLRNRFPAIVGQLPALDRPMVAPVPDEQLTQVPIRNQDQTTGLSVRAMVSPDLSSVGLTNFSRPGTNVGLLLEYQFRRWHVQVGVLRSVKVYQAAESAYDYSVVRQWPVVPSSIDGRCNMLDTPINLRYDVALIPRQRALPPSRWFISAGATTYYMLREDYTYTYDNPADPKIKYRDWTTETGRYGFSQLNLSVGYERAVTQRLFWQVEPFLKVPLKGVGYYKINLLSTGAFFSLRYRL